MDTIRELDEIIADRTSIERFMTAVREAQVNKEHIYVDVVNIIKGVEFSIVINGVNADEIQYIEKDKRMIVGGWRDPYSLTFPVTQDIFVEDITSGLPVSQGMAMQYTFQTGSISTSFLFQYDEACLDESI